MTGGFTFKRCSCPPVAGVNGRPLACKRKHGSWFFAAESRTPDGKRRQVRRGGYATQADAQLALTAFAEARNTGQVTDDRTQSVSEYLNQWLAKKITNGLRPTTARGYRQHIDTYIAPVIGTLRLRDVRPPHVEDVLTFAARPRERGKTPGPATVRRVHATMRSAFASAKRQRYIPYNPAVDVDLPKAARPTVRPWEDCISPPRRHPTKRSRVQPSLPPSSVWPRKPSPWTFPGPCAAGQTLFGRPWTRW